MLDCFFLCYNAKNQVNTTHGAFCPLNIKKTPLDFTLVAGYAAGVGRTYITLDILTDLPLRGSLHLLGSWWSTWTRWELFPPILVCIFRKQCFQKKGSEYSIMRLRELDFFVWGWSKQKGTTERLQDIKQMCRQWERQPDIMWVNLLNSTNNFDPLMEVTTHWTDTNSQMDLGDTTRAKHRCHVTIGPIKSGWLSLLVTLYMQSLTLLLIRKMQFSWHCDF